MRRSFGQNLVGGIIHVLTLLAYWCSNALSSENFSQLWPLAEPCRTARALTLALCALVTPWITEVLVDTETFARDGSRDMSARISGFDEAVSTPATVAEVGSSHEDEFVEISGSGGSRQRWKGRIVDFSSAGLVLQLADGTERHFPAEKVVRYSPNTLMEWRKATEAIRAGKIADAVTLLVQARSQETREWRRREITAELVRCLYALGDYHRAGSEFVTGIILADEKSPFLSCIPLAWFAEDSLASAEASARTWLTANHPWVRLLGASYLLTGPHGSQAAAVLEQLRLAPDKMIAVLAFAQLWRRTWATARVEDLSQWESSLDGLPGELKAGPYYVLGTAWAFQSQREKALLCFLRPPYLWPENRRVAARCLWEAAQLMQVSGRQQPEFGGSVPITFDQNAVLEELVRRFPESPWAARVLSLSSSSSSAGPGNLGPPQR